MASSTQRNKPFSKEVSAVLESLYNKGMTGWESKHIEFAIERTGLQLSQVKVWSTLMVIIMYRLIKAVFPQNWIRRQNMKSKAVEDTETVLPTKKVLLATWQQYLKPFSKSEGTLC